MSTYVKSSEIWRIACPIMLGNLAQTIITFTDTAFLGHVGNNELSASVMAGLFYYVFTTLAMGFAVGIQIFIARRFGEANYRRIGEVFSHGAFFVFMLGVLLFGVMCLSGENILRQIIASTAIYTYAIDYFSFRQYGIIFVVFNYLFRSLYVGISNTKAITYSTLLMAVVNIFFDYSLIFGNFGFPEIGIRGAAIASFLAEMSATTFFIIYTSRVLPPDKYAIFHFHKIRFELMWRILKVAFPSMLQRLFSFGTWFLFFVFIEKMSEMAIGVSSVVRSTYMILIIPGFAFAATANTLTSRLIGEGKSNEVMSMLKRVIKNSFLASAVIAFFTATFPMVVLRIYTDDLMLINNATPAVYVIGIATLISSVAMIFFEAISGTGRTIYALLLEMAVLINYVGYLYFTTTHNFEIQYVWCAEFVYNILIGIISYSYLRRLNWQKTGI